jgi:N-acylneuraminate cytidylyltransferase
LPRKNIADFNGKPMLHRVVETAIASELFERVYVSTEDDEIAGIAARAGAVLHHRPFELATDTATVTQVCTELLASLAHTGEKPEHFCCIYATAALIRPEDLRASHRLFMENDVDVVMGVSAYPVHPYRAMRSVAGYLQPMWPEENEMDSKAFPHMTASNGTIYWAGAEYFQRNPDFYAERLIGYEMERDRAVDIDTMDDLQWAAMVGRALQEKVVEVE